MKLLTYLYRQAPKYFLLAIITGIIGGLAAGGLIGVIGNSISHPMVTSEPALRFFGLCVLYLMCKSVSETTLLRLTQDAVLQMRVRLSKKFLAVPYSKLQSMGKSKLLAIFTKDIETFLQATQLVPVVFGNLVVILACMSYVAFLSVQVFIFILITMIICTIGFQFAEKRPLLQLKAIRVQLDLLYEHFRSLIEGSKELQLNAKRGNKFIEKVLTPASSDFRHLFVKSMTSYIGVLNIGALMFYIVIGFILFIFPVFAPQKHGVLPNITLVLLYLIRPIAEVMSHLPPLRQAAVSLQRIQQLDHDMSAIPPNLDCQDPFSSSEASGLVFSNVYHQYPSEIDDGHFTLGPLNFSIIPGELIFIIGGNGSGKTTLAMLMLGLYAPERGQIILNGTEVTEQNRFHYRQNFSAVFSDFHLFEQLLSTNDSINAEHATHYIKALAMEHKVKVADGKFSTTDLSSGQRKRLALVSAYMEDRSVYLFDEWAADQDPAFKRVFYTELLPELKAKGKTVIVISHDDTYFGVADRVIKIENGQLQSIADSYRPKVEPLLRPARIET